LILTARRRERLESFKREFEASYRIQVDVVPADLATTDAAANLYQIIQQKNCRVEVLINNAGFGIHGDFLQSNPKRLQEMITLNVLSLTMLTRLLSEPMKKRGSGYILLVGSMASVAPLPYYAAYAASKAYVAFLGEALYAELKPYGIHVTTLHPGPTQTEFFQVAQYKRDRVSDLVNMDAQTVARIGLDALFKKQITVTPGASNKVIGMLMKTTPRSWTRRLVAAWWGRRHRS
jgi:hypothetical protein